MQQQRGQWGSTFGFVLAAAGSAIGLGNIWAFPFVTGQNGGAAFVVVYLLCVALICVPYLFAELALGRVSQKNPVGAILAIRAGSPWVLVGALGVLTGVAILSFYAVIAGYSLGYIGKSLIAPAIPFEAFSADWTLVVPLFAAFMLLTVLVVLGGVEKGIERAAKTLMPVLLVLMLLVILRGATLPGAAAGLEFYLRPDFSTIDMANVVRALGQAFFSLSLGMGAMITYGSYLPKTADLRKSGLLVATLDTGIALLAGLMIFPAVFAMKQDPAQGTSLVFQVLPKVFEAMPLGGFFSPVFFILLSIAALTSTVSLLEVVVSYFVDERNWTRTRACWIVGFATFLIGLPSALSAGAVPWLTNVEVFGQKGFLAIMAFLFGSISLAVGGMLLSVFVGWVWGARRAGEELRQGSTISGTAVRLWGFFVRFVCPIFILIVLLNVFGVV